MPTEPDADPGPDGNTVVSGSRLRRRELATPDGASGETTLWDSELEVPCSFERATGSRVGQGMSMRMVLADDGAVWPDAIVDEERGEPCRPDRESGRCLPAWWAVFWEGDRLRDVSCEQRVVAVDACHGSTLRGRESTCAPWSFYEYGDEVEPDALSQRGEDNVCEPAENVTGTPVTVGPLIPFETFPVVDIVTVGEGTVREQRMVDAAGDSLMTGDGGPTLYDESLQERCWPALMIDGSLRCLPPALPLTVMPLYADLERCGVASSVYALGEELESEEVYWELAGCSLALPFMGSAPGALSLAKFRKYDSAVVFKIRQSWRILDCDGTRG